MNMKYMQSDLGQRGHMPLSFAAAGASDKDSGLWKSYVRPDSALLRMGVKATEITDNGFTEGLNKEDVKNIVAKNLEGKLTLIKGDSIEMFPGIRTFIGSKHTWESQHLLINTKTDKVILASDDCWFYYNVEHLLPITYYLFDPNAYVKQLKRMRVLQPNTSLIIPGHDPLVFSKFPKVAEGIVKIR